MNFAKNYAPVFLSFFGLSAAAHASYGNGLWVFGGAGAGGVVVQSKEINPTGNPVAPNQKEQDKIGFSGNLRGGVSWYLSNSLVADAMLGFNYSKVSGKTDSTVPKITITHQTGLFELSPRYRFGDEGKLQLGPIYKLYFGTDTQYSEVQGQNRNQKPLSHYVGLKATYEFPNDSESMIYRFGLEGLTDISDPRQIYVANAVFELGFNLFGGESNAAVQAPAKYDEEKRVAPVKQDFIDEDLAPYSGDELPASPPESEVPQAADIPTATQDFTAEELPPAPEANSVSTTVNGNALVIRFPGDRFRFATGMSHIGFKPTREYLRLLGEFLSQHPETWGAAVIVGHTDPRGPAGRARAVNMELSEARAKTVRDTLVNAGVNTSRLTYEGHAFDDPVPGTKNNPQGWKINRRVEITFRGVKKPDLIVARINELNQKFGFGTMRATKK